MHCCLWFRSVFRVRGPWPKRYGYHLSINNYNNYVTSYSYRIFRACGGKRRNFRTSENKANEQVRICAKSS